MERRVLLAVVLSFLVLILYQQWIGPPPVPTDRQVSESEVGTTAESENLTPTQSGVLEPAAATVGQLPQVVTPSNRGIVEPVVSDTQLREVVIETELIRAVFSNRGASLLSWQLKEYVDDAGAFVELVPLAGVLGQPNPFSLVVREDPELTSYLDSALFRPSVENMTLTSEPGVLVFDYEDSSGLRVRKAYTFQPAGPRGYVVSVDASVTTAAGSQSLAIAWGPALGGARPDTSRMVFQQLPGAVYYGRAFEDGLLQEAELGRIAPEDIVEGQRYEGQFDFVGVDNHYFLAAVLPGRQQGSVNYRAVSADPHNLVQFDLIFETGVEELPFFLGPKDFDLLNSVDPERNLSRAVDFGSILGVIVVPLHQTLKGIHGFVGNYGWSIILLTVFINILIFPLRHKSVVSMRKMQELQPEMKAIQARYAHLKTTDPAKQKMNQEVMELYRRHGANPASGCLPMLLTMPILFAFYRLLSMAVELRGEPFLFWISDLSVKDPFFVTPVIMGASMVFQQRLQPSGADPMQQKIMMLMPVMFTFMFLWAPSGLVIYWLTSNVIGIGQQLLTNRIAGPPRIRQVRPPAERQVAESTVSSADPVPAKQADGGEGQRTRDFGPPQKSGRRGKKSGRSKGKAR
tara:strand:- start:1266 stop:3155 length:1890 start_codon:yes stop_codon:yes gene_type:complete